MINEKYSKYIRLQTHKDASYHTLKGSYGVPIKGIL